MEAHTLVQELACRLAEIQAQNEMLLEHLTKKDVATLRKEVDLRAIEILAAWKEELRASRKPPKSDN